MLDTAEGPTQRCTQDAAASCANEPIHIPGRIQNHGALFSLDAVDTIVQASDNVEALLGWSWAEVVGNKPDRLIEMAVGESLAAVLASAREGKPTCDRVWVSPKNLPGAKFQFDMRVHCHDKVTLLELEPVDTGKHLEGVVLGEPELTLDALTQKTNLAALLDTLAVQVRRLTGFDLVMIYRFDAEWNGEVVAEDKAESAHSYLRQWFPASDIPAQARAVFRDNWSRMISDVDAPPSDLNPVCYPVTGRPLDLGRAQLRSPSPVHLQYLRNMGAAATFTVSLVAFDRLWGLVACHHAVPRRLDLAHRRLCEWVGRHASQRIESLQTSQDQDRTRALEEVVSRLHAAMSRSNRVADGLFKSEVSMLELLPRHTGAGIALLYDGRWHLAGQTPNLAALRDLYAWLSQQLVGSRTFVLESLESVYPGDCSALGGCAGLVAFSIQKRDPTVAIWLLPEVVRTIDWAGEPEKQVTIEGGRAKLHPRHSFARWRETVSNRAAPVLPQEIKVIGELRQAIVECDLQQQVAFERAARLELQAQRRRLSLLSEASLALGRSAELEVAMDAFAAALTPGFCDWCVVHAKRQGRMCRVAVRHATEEGQRIIAPMWDMPELGEADFGMAEHYKPVVEAEDLAQLISTPEHVDLVRNKLGCRSLIVKSMQLRGEVSGWIVFARGERRSPFLPEDAELASELAARSASAVESALYTEQLAASLAFRDQILNVVSHDLRNPLGVVWLSADGLKRQIDRGKPNLPELASRALLKINLACRRMDALIQDLLNLGKMQANRLSIAPKPQDCATLAHDSINELELLAGQTSVTLKLAPPAVPAPQVSCDRDRFLQVISNLVGNALKFSPAGSSITLGWRPRDGFVEFYVRDEGPGIAAEDLPRVFEAFWQGGSNKSRVKGAGLGLAIVKGIIEAHGGEVHVTSSPGAGAEFSFTLPVAS